MITNVVAADHQTKPTNKPNFSVLQKNTQGTEQSDVKNKEIWYFQRTLQLSKTYLKF